MNTDPPMAGPMRGFSLVELVLVVAILAVVAAIAIPRYSNALMRYRLEAGSRRIAADLQLAQQAARTASSSQTVVVDAHASRLRILGLSDLLRGTTGTYTTNLAQAPYHCRILSVDLGGDHQVIFDGFGQPDSGGQIVLGCGTLTRTVRLQAETGQVLLP